MHPISAGSPRALTLAAVLREAREHANISLREVGRRMGVAHTTIGRWEAGETVPGTDEVVALLECLQVPPEEREDTLALARGSVADDWLTSGAPGVTQQLAGLMDCEHFARHITQWAPLLIPGVLQTSAYARAMMARGSASLGDAEHRVMLRMARRDAITRRRDPTGLVALIGEPAIRGGIGGPAVMADQLRQVLDLTRRDNITIQVVSVAGEWHPGHAGPFLLYEFDARRRPTVYLEHHRTGAFVVDDGDTRDYRAAIDAIRGLGMSPDESLDLITGVIKTLEETS